ncbi:adenosylhomocysteinase [Demequina oxidasica]|uniref:adenosylhomocysteinase n=1 Tax=Demequina oxidasica TaxID=676199 RepID=UPI0007818CDF|nr:adenosylhomocysteinase [Demequina oxidasica]
MTDPARSSAFDEASRIIRRFARETNLLVAGRPFQVLGADAVAASLRTIASALGAQVVAEVGAPVTADLLEIDTHYAPALISLGGQPLESRGNAAGRVDFAGAHMPVTRALAAELAAAETLSGLRVGVCLTLEPKTAQLALHLAAAGAAVAVYAHPDEIDPEVANVLRERSIPVDGSESLSGEAERATALGFLKRGFDVLVDDGSHLVRLAHEDAPNEVAQWIGVSEETTSGLTPLRAMSAAGVLATPVIAVNDAATKTGFDNRYGTGQSCVFAIADLLDSAQVNIRERPALVIGYGPVGVGVAAHLRALGVEVCVAEVDPVRALLAQHDGYRVGRAAHLATGALVVSATGVTGTVPAPMLRDAFAVAVAGGVPGEIALDAALQDDKLEPVARDVERLAAAGTLVLDRGGCINVTAAEGNPIEIMDLSFATQLAAISELVSTRPGTGVHALSDAAVAHVGTVAARERGLKLDTPPATPVPPGYITPSSADATAAPPLGDAWHSGRFSIGRLAVPPSSQEIS